MCFFLIQYCCWGWRTRDQSYRFLPDVPASVLPPYPRPRAAHSVVLPRDCFGSSRLGSGRHHPALPCAPQQTQAAAQLLLQWTRRRDESWAGWVSPSLAQHIPTSVGMECVRTLWLSLTLALVLGSRVIGGHPQPCGVPTRAGASVRLAALLPRAPAARARVLAALTTPPPRLPYNLSLELVAVASPTRDPSSLARGLCQVLAPPGVVASIAFPEARPELRLLQFLAAATETPVLSVLRREVRAPLGAPVRRERGKPWGRGREAKAPHTSPTRRRRGPLSQPFPPKMPSARLG